MRIVDFGQNSLSLDAARQAVVLLIFLYDGRRADVTDLLGQDATLIVWHEEGQTWPPSYFLCRSVDGSYLLVIEGTTSLRQGIAHLAGTAGRRFIDGKTVANLLWHTVAEKMLADVARFLPAAGEPIVLRIAGHSYGAGLAHLLGCMFAQRYPANAAIQVLGIGEPRALGPGYSGPMPAQHWRLTSTYDIVPGLPPESQVPMLGLWGLPLNWSLVTPAWSHYGVEATIYENGSLASGPIPNPLPPGVSTRIPDAHYLGNYLGRLVANQQRKTALPDDPTQDPALPSAVDGMANVLRPAELPIAFSGPAGEPESIPDLTQASEAMALPQPTLMKHTWHFEGQAGETWSEVYYCLPTNGVTPDRTMLLANVPRWNGDTITARLAALWKGHELVSIRASFIGGDRLAADEVYNMTGTNTGPSPNPDLNGAEIVGKSAVLELQGLNGAQRKLWMRGWALGDLTSDAASGRGTLSAGSNSSVVNYIKALAAFPYGILSRVRKPSIQTVPENKLLTSTYSAPLGGTTFTTQRPHGLVTGSQVIIAKCSQKDMPGVDGIWTVTVPGGSVDTFTIPYIPPSGANPELGYGYARPFVLNVLDPISPAWSTFDYIGLHKSKMPLTDSRGAKRASRLRSMV